MKPKGLQTQIHAEDGGGILVIGLAMALVFICTAGVIWAFKQPTPLPGNKVVTYAVPPVSYIPGCMAANFIPKSAQDAEIVSGSWLVVSADQYLYISQLVKDKKAEIVHKPTKVCDGEPTDEWYWRMK
jgi:hypothetical protein